MPRICLTVSKLVLLIVENYFVFRLEEGLMLRIEVSPVALRKNCLGLKVED